MAKFTKKNVASGFEDTDALSENFTALETFSDTTLSRDGTSPNNMLADIDMNANRVINALTIDTTNLTVNGQTLVVPANPVTLPTDPQLYLDIIQGRIVLTANTVAAMVADTKLVVGDIVVTSGYYVVGDGGGNRYEIVAAATGVDDGGSFIDLTTHQAKALFEGDIFVEQFGAKGDNLEASSTINTASIQAAIDFMQVSLTSQFKHLRFGNGVFYIETKIQLKNHSSTFVRFPFTMQGAGGHREGPGTSVKASSTFTLNGEMFEYIDTAGVGTNAYYVIRDLQIEGNSRAGFGFLGVTAASFRFIDYSILNTTINGIKFESSEICSFIRGFFNGNLNCISLNGGTNNAVYMEGNEFSGNTGIGVVVINGSNFYFNGTMQSNRQCGIYLDNVRNYTIKGLFEFNGEDGITITTPAAAGTIKCDIILNGSGTTTTLGKANPCNGGKISASFSPLFGGPITTLHIFANAVNGLEVSDCNAAQSVLVGTWGEDDISLYKDISILRNGAQGDIDALPELQDFSILNTFAANNFKNPEHLHTIDFGIPYVNLAKENIYELYTEQDSSGAGGTFTRLDGFDLGLPVYRIADPGSNSTAFGLNLNEINTIIGLRNSWIWVGCFANLSTQTSSDFSIYIEFTGGTGPGHRMSAASTTQQVGRIFTSMAALVPAGATAMQFGFAKFGTGTGVIDLSTVQVSPLGVPYSASAFDRMPPHTFLGNVAPTTGTWVVGDELKDTTPTVGSPYLHKCTVAGTPGTWVGSANL